MLETAGARLLPVDLHSSLAPASSLHDSPSLPVAKSASSLQRFFPFRCSMTLHPASQIGAAVACCLPAEEHNSVGEAGAMDTAVPTVLLGRGCSVQAGQGRRDEQEESAHLVGSLFSSSRQD